MQTHAEEYCQELTSSKKARAEADKMKENHRGKIIHHVEKLASELEKGLLDDKQLRTRFDEELKKWIKELSCTAACTIEVNVEAEVDKSLMDSLNTHKKVATKPLRKWGCPLELKVESIHLQTHGALSSFAKPVGIYQAQVETDKFLKQVESDIAQKYKHNFNPSFISELLYKLFQVISKFWSETFNFTYE